MNAERVRVLDLILDPANVRKHDDRNLGAIKASLARFGQQKPVVIDGGNIVRAGNGTVMAAHELGWEWIECVRTELAGVEATAYAIADNRSAELASWDDLGLAQMLRSLQSEDFDLAAVGFTSDEVDALIEQLGDALLDNVAGDDPGDQTDRAEELRAKWGTARGQLWLIPSKTAPGKVHRLLCGDSTNEADVARLMGDERAVLMATDPPYLVNYQGGNHPNSWANKPETKDKHWDDYHEGDGPEFFARFLRAALKLALVPNPAVYQWHASRRQALVEQAWTENGLLIHQQIIWVKARAILTRSHFMWQHEPCFYGWVQGSLPDRRPPNNATTVWEIDQAGEQHGIHPTQKPLEIVTRPLEYHTAPGGLCYEPFSGSGTALAAAETTGRVCYGMELSEGFAAAILERLAGMGLEPRLAA